MSKNICVDLDGTLAYYTTWKSMGGRIGKPRPGAQQFLTQLQLIFDKIIIFTTRLNEKNRTPGTFSTIEKWLKDNEMPYNELFIGSGKPICKAFIDDKAISIPKNPVESDYQKTLDTIKRFVEI